MKASTLTLLQLLLHTTRGILCIHGGGETTAMLQLKQISKVLVQGLTRVPASLGRQRDPEDPQEHFEQSVLETLPLAVSLLLPEGNPLLTVTNDAALKETGISSDNLRIFLLLGYNYLHQNPLEAWGLIEVEKNLELMVTRLTVVVEGEPMYVALFYSPKFPRAVAKLKLDNIAAVLNLGLDGYAK